MVMNNQAQCLKSNFTLYVESDPRPLSAAKRPVLRLVETPAKPRPTLTWHCQPWVYAVSALPMVSVVYMMLDGFGLPVGRLLGL